MNYFLSALKNYAVFSGRSRRSAYWYFVLFNILFAIVFAMLARFSGFALLYSAYSLAVLIPGIAVAVRRMHDVDKSGWFILIPIYNLILACTEGTQGPNRFGSDPKRPEFDEFLSDHAEPGQPA
jgi:uncharacterized membrane protein YhaH (DUF805 family)